MTSQIKKTEENRASNGMNVIVPIVIYQNVRPARQLSHRCFIRNLTNKNVPVLLLLYLRYLRIS